MKRLSDTQESNNDSLFACYNRMQITINLMESGQSLTTALQTLELVNKVTRRLNRTKLITLI